MPDVSSFKSEWLSTLRFGRVSKDEKGIVFHSESSSSSPHLMPLVSQLATKGETISILTDRPGDPMDRFASDKIRIYPIGQGMARTWAFSFLAAKILVTTTPDLQTMQLKRSRLTHNYVYVHHSMISTHMGYRPDAFDNFDGILCTGKYQIDEIRAREAQLDLPPKDLYEHGYSRLDSLLEQRSLRSVKAHKGKGPDTVLVAPTWGANSILPICGVELIEVLLDEGFRVILRPHPETVKRDAGMLEKINKKFRERSDFAYDDALDQEGSLLNSDVMISDWSGVALEYAYGLNKPVLFIDVPAKVNNPGYEELNIVPHEVSIRDQIGEILGPRQLTTAPSILRAMLSSDGKYEESRSAARQANVFNIGTSAQAGANILRSIVSEAD